MRIVLFVAAILSLCGCMTKNVTLYVDIYSSDNATITVNDTQTKPMDVLREFSGSIPLI